MLKEANILMRSGDYDGAIAAYNRIIEAGSPLSALAKSNLAIIERRVRRSRDFAQESRPAPSLKLSPRDPLPLPAVLDSHYRYGTVQAHSPTKHDELVSIIMPSFNNAPWLTRAAHSALSQAGVNIELIIVDDGSTDASVEIARQLAKDKRNVKVISLLRNFGCYYARNIGLLNSVGKYIAILDSDDIMLPDRISRQLDLLKGTSGAVASQTRLRRWNEDFSRPLSELKYAENSLVWRRDIIDRMGPYDTVRYGGDSEFRIRLERTYGVNAIAKSDDEFYFLRTLDGSLTATGVSQAYSVDNGVLKLNLSKSRQQYSENFATWQKKNKPSSPTAPTRMRIEFPQLSRPFALGDTKQNASPSLGQRRVGAMASYPPRQSSLKKTIDSILPQIDEIILYLNEYDAVPAFADHPKIRTIRSQTTLGDLRDNGKFYNLAKSDAYIFTFDDDLIYPPDYTSRMIHHIEMLERTCVVGAHGVIFPNGDFTSLKQRTVFHFGHRHSGKFVDLLGTGTTAWHCSRFRPTLADFKSKGVCDVWFAAAAAKANIPLLSIPREKGWIREQKESDNGLFQQALGDPSSYFEIYHKVLKPVLQNGAVRRQMEARMTARYELDALSAAGFDLTS